MKAVMIAVMVIGIGGFYHFFEQANHTTALKGTIQESINLWIVCAVLLIVSILAFLYACKLGRKEDEIKRLEDDDIRSIYSQFKHKRK